MKQFFKTLFLFLVAVVIVSFAVANRDDVRFVLDPFRDREGAPSITAPFYIYLFAALFVGMIIGAFVMWMGQGRWRKQAHTHGKEAVLWKREAEN